MTAPAPEAVTREGDEEAIARVLAGETAAFRVLVERYEATVLRLVRNLAPRSTGHEDLAQEAFVAAFVALATFDGQRGRFASWLLTIAKNKCLNARKKMAPIPVAEPPTGVCDTTPADELARADVRRSLDAALEALPADLRTCFVLAEIVGLAAEEIAEMEAVSPGTIRSRLSRAKARLRAALEPLQGGHS
jgi:RNA polymerase sigma-70 factor, ECF subfamily